MKTKGRRQSKNVEQRYDAAGNKLNFMESVAKTFHTDVTPLKKLKSAKKFMPGMDKNYAEIKSKMPPNINYAAKKARKAKFLEPKKIK